MIAFRSFRYLKLAIETWACYPITTNSTTKVPTFWTKIFDRDIIQILSLSNVLDRCHQRSMLPHVVMWFTTYLGRAVIWMIVRASVDADTSSTGIHSQEAYFSTILNTPSPRQCCDMHNFINFYFKAIERTISNLF